MWFRYDGLMNTDLLNGTDFILSHRLWTKFIAREQSRMMLSADRKILERELRYILFLLPNLLFV